MPRPPRPSPRKTAPGRTLPWTMNAPPPLFFELLDLLNAERPEMPWPAALRARLNEPTHILIFLGCVPDRVRMQAEGKAYWEVIVSDSTLLNEPLLLRSQGLLRHRVDRLLMHAADQRTRGSVLSLKYPQVLSDHLPEQEEEEEEEGSDRHRDAVAHDIAFNRVMAEAAGLARYNRNIVREVAALYSSVIQDMEALLQAGSLRVRRCQACRRYFTFSDLRQVLCQSKCGVPARNARRDRAARNERERANRRRHKDAKAKVLSDKRAKLAALKAERTKAARTR